MTPLPALSQLTRLLVHSDGGAALLGRLHEHLLETAGGLASVVLHVNPGTATVRASSACRVEYLPLEPWVASPAEQAAIDAALSNGRLVPLDLPPGSRTGQLLAADACVIVPLAGPEGASGVVVVGLAAPVPVHDEAQAQRVLAVADAFVLALERARWRRDADLRREVDGVIGTFRNAATSWSELNQALADVCRSCARLFVANRAAVWLHDRRARELVLAASSEGGHGHQFARVAVVDSLSRAAAALRRGPPELASDAGLADAPPYLLVPLRGHRRALGVLELEGLHILPGDEAQVIEASTALGRELAAVIENVLLLYQTVRAEREIARVLDSVSDLVIICDADLRVIRNTPALGVRAGVPAEDIAGREIRELLGDAFENRIREAAATDTPSRRGFRTQGTMFGRPFTVDVTSLDHEDDAAGGFVLVAREGPFADDGSFTPFDRAPE